MEHTLNLNQNSAECIKAITKFGETVYVNICSGQSVSVPWGSVDWVLAIVLTFLGIGLAAAMVAVFIAIVLALK